jgi:hypothetical protein
MRQAAARFAVVHAALAVGLAMAAMLVCGAALAVVRPGPAAVADAVARRVAQTQHVALKTQFASVEACVRANSAPCLQNAAFVFYDAASRAKARVVALRARPLSASVRSGINRQCRALDLQAQYGYELYHATESLDIPRIYRALANIRAALADAGQAITLIYS